MLPVFFIQQNFAVGDIAGNIRLIKDAADRAAAADCPVALTPELALTGYPPEDLLYLPALRRQVEEALPALAAALPPQLAVVVGAPLWEDGALYNAAALLRGGGVEATYKKAYLPNFSVFDEKRYFAEHRAAPLVFAAGGARYAVQICQDIWVDAQLPLLAQCAADAVLVLNGSPFYAGKQAQRIRAAQACARHSSAALFYANGIGAEDELVFDGASFAVDKDGALAGQLPAFAAHSGAADAVHPYPEEEDSIHQALVCGLRDYAEKSRFASGVVLGLSGGADSALVAALATAALGRERVCAVMLPTCHTSDASLEYAQQLAQALGIEYHSIPLTAAVESASALLQPLLQPRRGDVTAENLQARLRGTLLMALANNRDALLLATGNKSEFACGYATLYGDMNGGFAPLKDALKTQVWSLCRHYNARINSAIPPRIIARAPSAELRPNQTDQDSLPPYDLLDAIIRDHLAHRPPAEMIGRHGAGAVRDFYRRLAASEHKRRQAPPGTKISECAFGRDWRLPINSGFSHEA